MFDMPIIRFLVKLQNLWQNMTFLELTLWSFIYLMTAIIFAIYYQRQRIYKRLTACRLPTIFWTPKFVTYNPANYQDSADKLSSSTITNILPRMERLKGPYGMYGTVYGWNTPVIHVAHPVPARAVLSASSNTTTTAPTDSASNQKSNRSNKTPCASIQNSIGATKAPAYNHFRNFCGEGVFTADGQDWKTKRAAVTHALLRVDGGFENAIEKEAHRALLRLMDELDHVVAADETVDIVPLLQRATIGLIYRYITHSDLETRMLTHKNQPQ
jgi:hypothetical protein